MPRDPLRAALRRIEGRLLQDLCTLEEQHGITLDLRLVRGEGGRLTVVAIDPADDRGRGRARRRGRSRP